MDAVGPIGGGFGRINPANVTGNQSVSGGSASGQAAATGSSQTLSSQTMSISSSTTHIAQASARVDAFLADLGGDLRNNELLKMIIGLLILELLLGRDGESAPGNGSEFGALNQLAQTSESSRTLLIQSSTSVYQADYYATELAGARSVQSSAGTQSDNHSGGQLDLSA